MGVNHPLQDVNSDDFVARTGSGLRAENPLDGGGHESRESAVGVQDRAKNTGDVGVHDVPGQPDPAVSQS